MEETTVNTQLGEDYDVTILVKRKKSETAVEALARGPEFVEEEPVMEIEEEPECEEEPEEAEANDAEADDAQEEADESGPECKCKKNCQCPPPMIIRHKRTVRERLAGVLWGGIPPVREIPPGVQYRLHGFRF